MFLNIVDLPVAGMVSGINIITFFLFLGYFYYFYGNLCIFIVYYLF
mgnify:CR=1 FL=1|jgi:hypothetical protein